MSFNPGTIHSDYVARRARLGILDAHTLRRAKAVEALRRRRIAIEEQTRERIRRERRQDERVSQGFAAAEELPHPIPPSEVHRICTTIAVAYGLTVADLVGKSRKARIVIARQTAMAHIRPLKSLHAIGLIFRRDHTTVVHSVRCHGAAIGAYVGRVAEHLLTRGDAPTNPPRFGRLYAATFGLPGSSMERTQVAPRSLTTVRPPEHLSP